MNLDADAATVGRLEHYNRSVPTPSVELIPYYASTVTTIDHEYAR